MPAINFPQSPYVGQQYTASNNIAYVWDGEKWESQASLFGAGTNYILPIATNSRLGGVQIGAGIDVDVNGVISIPLLNQSNWNETDATHIDYIKNKPTITNPVQSDWNETDSSQLDYIKNKPSVPQLPTNAVGYLYNNGSGTLSWSTPAGGGSTGNIGFVTDYLYDFNGITIENADLSHGATAAVSIPANGNTSNPILLSNLYGGVRVTSGITGATQSWDFNGDGELVLPQSGAAALITAVSGGSIQIQPKPGSIETSPNGGNLLLYAGAADTDHNAAGGNVHILATNKNGGGQDIIDGIVDITTAGGTWTFDSNGDTIMPLNGNTLLNYGHLYFGDYGVGTNMFVDEGYNLQIYTNTGGQRSGNWIFGTNGSTTLPSGAGFGFGESGQLKVNDGTTLSLDIRDQSGRGFYTNSDGYTLRSNGTYNWIFGSDGTLTVPGDIKSTAGTGDVVVEANDGTARTWTFGGDGTLTLPEGGDIVDHTGTTVFKTNLSSFTNDLEIDADSLTGTTLNSGVTDSSLTSVGTLTSLTSSGAVHITNTEDSTNADSGALQVDGGAHITKNLIAEGTIYAGIDAYSEALTNPLIVASAPSGVSGGYSQVAILNNTAEASGDFQVMVDGYDINGPAGDTGWSDLGMSGSNFSDPRYTITNPQDGYVFVSAMEGTGGSGSLVLGTDNTGTNNDIVFATGGFTTDREKMRLNNADGSLTLKSGLINSDDNIVLTSGTPTYTSSASQVTDNGTVIHIPKVVSPSIGYQVSVGYQVTTTWGGRTVATVTNVASGVGGMGAEWLFTINQDVSLGFVGGSPLTFGSGISTLTFSSHGVLGLGSATGVIYADQDTGRVSIGDSIGYNGAPTAPSTMIHIGGDNVFEISTYGPPSETWVFDRSGNIHLPVGGDIKDSDGNSVFSSTYTLPTASNTVLGGVKVDGSTIVIVDGVISATGGGAGGYSLPTASTSILGGVKVDGTTITINNEVISAVIPTSLSAFTNEPGYLTSVTTITGNAGTATKLATSRNINGVAFDGTGDITVTAAAGTLTGTTLNAGVTGSSLTSVGTLVNLTVTNTITGSVTGSAGNAPAGTLTGTTLNSTVVSSSLTSVGTLANLTVTNPIVGTVQNGIVSTGSYANPTWITSLAYSKLTGTPTGLVTTADTGTVTNTMLAGSIANAKLANSSITIGTTAIALGASSTTLAGLTGVTSSGNIAVTGTGKFSGDGSLLTNVTVSNASNIVGTGTNVNLVAGSYTWTFDTTGLATLPGTTTSTGTITSNATNAFIASGSAVNNVALGLQTTAGTAANMAIRDSSTVASTIYYDVSIGGVANGNHSFRSSSNYTQLASIGQYGITLPTRPAFRVYGSGTTTNLTTTVNTSGILNGNNFAVDYQQGTALTTSTGIFTAPVAGLYSVHLVARVSNTASAQIAVVKNYAGTSSVQAMWECGANCTANHFGVSSIVKLAAGDTLVIKVLLGQINFDTNDSWAVAYIG